MTRLDALRGLYDAVKAGLPLVDLPRPAELHTDLVWKATQGSVDAALALIAATLPGWLVLGIDQDSKRRWYVTLSRIAEPAYANEVHKQPATALLLANLGALIAIEEGKG